MWRHRVPEAGILARSAPQAPEGLVESDMIHSTGRPLLDPAEILKIPRINAQSLMLHGEIVRGTLDLSDDQETEMEEFSTGLSEAQYSFEELSTIRTLLKRRRGLGDKERKELVSTRLYHEHSSHCSESEASGTDTDGSDADDEIDFEVNDFRQTRARKRVKLESTLLKPHLVSQRLREVSGPNEEIRQKAMFGAGKRTQPSSQVRAAKPGRAQAYYRKSASFNHPGVNVGERAKLPNELSDQQSRDLVTINALLALGLTPATAAQLVDSKFAVAQYRGLFYSRSRFTHDARADHRNLDEVDRPIFSAAALAEGQFGQAGYHYLQNRPERRTDLDIYQRELQLEGLRIQSKLASLRQQPITEEVRGNLPRATDRLQPITLADASTHLFSNDYDGYHELLKNRASDNPLAPLVRGLPNDSNPKVSTGDVPTHAARYAYGLKPYKGKEDDILEPQYGDQGRPRHPYSGKMYVLVHPLADYQDETGPSQVVPLQNEGRTNVRLDIVPERESQFEGMIQNDRVKGHMKAKFPDFYKPYERSISDRYGLTETLYADFKTALAKTESGTTERVFVESLLSNYLAQHSELRAIETAADAAEKQGARLVYRTGPRSFGTEPPAIGTSNTKAEARAPEQRMEARNALALVAARAISFRTKEQESESSRMPAPPTLNELVEAQFGPIITIAGDDIACYIRSLVTAAKRVHGLLDGCEIEPIVGVVIEHLENIQMRTPGQMVDAGGLVAAEVRLVLQQLTGGIYQPAVHVVMWSDSTAQITNFPLNEGTHHVWLFYTPGHFDLIHRSAT